MSRLVFVVPCHGRHALAAACLAQLRRTCDELAAGGLWASAVLVSADNFFRGLARGFRFDHVTQANQPLGRKLNDGYEWACTGMRADVVVPFGSDDVVDTAFMLEGGLPAEGEIRCCRRSAIVSEDGGRLSLLELPYERGDGVRFYPRALLEPMGFRPCRDGRERALDSNTLLGAGVPRYFDLHPLQIVDFKTGGANLNDYAACHSRFGVSESRQPWADLQGWYPDEFLEEVRAVYEPGLVAA